jgi:hypothetical protein
LIRLLLLFINVPESSSKHTKFVRCSTCLIAIALKLIRWTIGGSLTVTLIFTIRWRFYDTIVWSVNTLRRINSTSTCCLRGIITLWLIVIAHLICRVVWSTSLGLICWLVRVIAYLSLSWVLFISACSSVKWNFWCVPSKSKHTIPPTTTPIARSASTHPIWRPTTLTLRYVLKHAPAAAATVICLTTSSLKHLSDRSIYQSRPALNTLRGPSFRFLE